MTTSKSRRRFPWTAFTALVATLAALAAPSAQARGLWAASAAFNSQFGSLLANAQRQHLQPLSSLQRAAQFRLSARAGSDY